MAFRKSGQYYWSDPDAGSCSADVFVVKEDGEKVTVTHKLKSKCAEGEYTEFEVLASELCAISQSNKPRYVIAGVNQIDSDTGEPKFWSTEHGWTKLVKADALSIRTYDNLKAGRGTVAGDYVVLQLPADVVIALA